MTTPSIYVLAFVCTFAFFGCSSSKGDLPVVKTVDLQRYAGTWYEILSLPNSFEGGPTCITANYSLKDNGDIKVLNSGHKVDDPSTINTSTGNARMPNPQSRQN
jgi:lipocalin